MSDRGGSNTFKRKVRTAVAGGVVTAVMATACASGGPARGAGPDVSAVTSTTVPVTTTGVVREVSLRLGRTSRLTIGALGPFDYDGRSGNAAGTMSELVDGTWRVEFPRAATRVPPLAMVPSVPDLPVRVNISPSDLVGTYDPCASSLELAFEATFQPEAFGYFPAPLRVVTPLITGAIALGGDTLAGSAVDAFGHARLVGVAPIARTGDALVDGILSLPTAAVAELDADLDVLGGLPRCPASLDPAPEMSLEIGGGSRLSISSFGPFSYDGESIAMRVALEPSGSGRFDFTIPPDALVIPPLRLVSPTEAVRIEIDAREFRGTINVCSGAVSADFDASFQPVAFGLRPAAVAVTTTLTTGESTGRGRTAQGSPIDGFGRARMVGVADVGPTGDPLVDALLALPADAVADLEAHVETIGAPCLSPPRSGE